MLGLLDSACRQGFPHPHKTRTSHKNLTYLPRNPL